MVLRTPDYPTCLSDMVKKATKSKDYKDPISMLRTEGVRSRISAGRTRLQALNMELDMLQVSVKATKKMMVEELDFSSKEVTLLVKVYVTDGLSEHMERLESNIALRYEVSEIDPSSIEPLAESGAIQALKDVENRKRVDTFLDDIAGMHNRIFAIKEEMKELKTALVDDLSCSPNARKVILETLVKADIDLVIATEEGYLQMLNAYKNGVSEDGDETT